jgi:hypothetical protein
MQQAAGNRQQASKFEAAGLFANPLAVTGTGSHSQSLTITVPVIIDDFKRSRHHCNVPFKLIEKQYSTLTAD